MAHVLTILALGMLALGAATASAQSLGDVARKEEARRKTARQGKVYTNGDLTGAVPTPAPPLPGGTSAAQVPPTPAGAQGTAPADKPADQGDDPRKNEAHWRGRMQAARDALERARMFHDALQSRINALGNDFAARDDPAQRNQIAGDRQKAMAEMDRVKKEIADSEKAIRDIEDEARKAGVPPGWVR
jgi:hypothetical protein